MLSTATETTGRGQISKKDAKLRGDPLLQLIAAQIIENRQAGIMPERARSSVFVAPFF